MIRSPFYGALIQQQKPSLIQAQHQVEQEKCERKWNFLCNLLLDRNTNETIGGSVLSQMEMWIIQTISKLPVLDSVKAKKFLQLIESILTLEDDEKDERKSKSEGSHVDGFNKTSFAALLIHSVCKQNPKQVASIFTSNRGIKEFCAIFERFFFENSTKMNEFFRFTFDGNNKAGALALEQFLFQNREKIWHKIKWSGRRAYSPPVVIQKKNLLMEIDVYETLKMLSDENVVDNHANTFWKSDYFRDALSNGKFLELDVDLFVKLLCEILLSPKNQHHEKLMEIISQYIKSQNWNQLCNYYLPILLSVESKKIYNNLNNNNSNNENNNIPNNRQHENILCDLMFLLIDIQTCTTIEEKISAKVLCVERWNSFENILILNALLNFSKQTIQLIIDLGKS